MRIQHNIPALNAYSSYTKNVAAMKKNLEKLSSGYRINRAGDDAAGLAISEKMRAQITGLQVAQKNAKDGISLVQTAEGAMTEVHDMLNRMYELAEQSANGTYDNETDRAQMQKEIVSLSSEIDRIADSSNFNGIKLVDGSLSSKAVAARTTTMEGKLPSVGEVLGTNTVLHKDAGTSSNTTFGVELHNLEFNNDAGESFKLKIGNDEFTYTADAGNTAAAGNVMDAEDIVDAFLAGEFKDSAGNAVTATSVTVGNGTFKVTKNGTTGLTFEQQSGDPVSPKMEVTVTGSAAVAKSAATFTGTPAGFDSTPANSYDGTAGSPGKYTFDLAGTTINGAGILTVEVAGTSVDVEVEATTTDAQLATLVATALNGKIEDGITTGSTFTVAVDNTTNTKIVLTGSGNGAGVGLIANGKTTLTMAGKAIAPGSDPISGDYNKSTTAEVSASDAGKERLASTYFNLTDSMVGDGNTITIGKETYTFTTDASKNGTAGMVYIGDLDMNDSASLSTVAERLTDAAKTNTTYTVGHDGKRMTFTEIEDQTDCDLTTLEGVEKSFGFTRSSTGNSPLTLQIGDTSDEYNQLRVDINDCHTDAMGIGDIDISTQDGASAAMKKIKNAINYVSDVRGDLGALQNRLDHTINNLSAMHENIQDAESTIRDVDIAEEMMAYTKNNILVQSSQAMLAQANQLPQGVLQLLQ